MDEPLAAPLMANGNLGDGGSVTLSEHTLTISNGAVRWGAGGDAHLFKHSCAFPDILGCTSLMDQLIIHAFPRAAPSCCGGDATKRKAAMHTLRCPNPGIASSVAETVRKAVGIKQPKMLVLINPFGGGGKAPRVWRQLQPLLETAGLELEVTVTRAAGHAKQIAKELEIGKYDALISVSGDGLVNEIVNGLLSRDDGMEAMARTPIAVAPGGTGNGLFRSLCHFAGEAGDLVGAAFLIAKGVPSPLDLWSFVRPAEAGGDGGEGGGSAAAEEVLSWSFLSFMWGIISDVDLESEVCRCCGPLRLTMYGLLRIANARRYSGTFAYLDAASDEWVTIDSRQWLGIWACNVPYMTESDFAAPEAELDNGVLDILLLDGTSRFQALSMFLAIEEGKHLSNSGLTLVKAKAFKLTPAPRTPHRPGWLDVDGEVIPFGAVEARPHPRAMRVLLPERQTRS